MKKTQTKLNIKNNFPVAEKILFFLIILLAFILRIYQLDQMPPSPNWDEVSLGYNSYSILHTGRDEWGNFLPSVFRAYGDYKLPVYVYALAPFIKVFGLNTFSIRLLSAIAGTISIYIFYLICRYLFPHKKSIHLIGTAIFAFSPWSIFLSRIALEANLGLTIFLTSFYFLITQKYWQSSFFYAIFLFTYNSSRVLLPFYLLALLILIIKNKYPISRKWFGFVPLLILLSLFVYQSVAQNATDRYKWVTLLDSGAINQINELQSQYGRLVVNKATYLTYRIAKNYFLHFNPKYIFWNGGSQYQFNLPDFNLINSIFIIPAIIGLLFLTKNNWLILLFLLISPIPSAITRDAPHILRSLTFLPLITLAIVYGINQLSTKKWHYIFVLIFIVAISLNLITFWQKYQQYSQDYSASWQYGNKQIAEYITNNLSNSQNIYITKKYGEPHEFLLFFTLYPPQKYQSIPKDWNFHADWYWVDGFDKYHFLNDWDIQSYQFTSGDILITSPSNYPQEGSELLKSITNPRQERVYDIIRFNNNE